MVSNKIFSLSISVACLICFLMGNAWTIVPSIGNNLLEGKSALNQYQYAHISTILVIAAILFSFILGSLGRKRGMKTILLLGSISLTAGLISFSLCYSFNTSFSKFVSLLIGQFFLGIGIASIFTSLNTYLSLLTPKLTAMIFTGVYACVNLGSFTCPVLINFFPIWWKVALFFAIALFLITILAYIILPDLRNPYQKDHRGIIEVLREQTSPVFWMFFGAIILYAICEITFTAWGVIYLKKYKSLSAQQANNGLSLYWATVMFGQLSVFFLVRKISPKIIYRILPILIIAGLLGIYLATGDYSSISLLALGGLGTSGFFALTISLVEYEFRPISEFVSGIMMTGYFLGSIFGLVFFGLLLEFTTLTLSMLFLVVGFISVILAIICQYLVKKSKFPISYH